MPPPRAPRPRRPPARRRRAPAGVVPGTSVAGVVRGASGAGVVRGASGARVVRGRPGTPGGCVRPASGAAQRRVARAGRARLYKALPIAGGAVVDVEARPRPPPARLPRNGRRGPPWKGRGLAGRAPAASAETALLRPREPPEPRAGPSPERPPPPRAPRASSLAAPEPQVGDWTSREGRRGGPCLPGARRRLFSLSVSRSSGPSRAGSCAPHPAREGMATTGGPEAGLRVSGLGARTRPSAAQTRAQARPARPGSPPCPASPPCTASLPSRPRPASSRAFRSCLSRPKARDAAGQTVGQPSEKSEEGRKQRGEGLLGKSAWEAGRHGCASGASGVDLGKPRALKTDTAARY